MAQVSEDKAVELFRAGVTIYIKTNEDGDTKIPWVRNTYSVHEELENVIRRFYSKDEELEFHVAGVGERLTFERA